jgi:hypothetical protein
MLSFIYEALPSRVIFGVGCLGKVAEEAERLNVSRALVLSTPEQAETAHNLAGRLGARGAGVYSNAVMHVPAEIAKAVGLSVSLGVAIQREFKYGRIFFEETCSSDTLQPGCGQDISAVSGSEDVFPVVYSEELPHR